MIWLAGIDEAGYGPTLGPLVVSATLWRIEEPADSIDLWRDLRSCVCRAGSRRDWRLVIDDSKAAFDRKQGLHSLERTVLAFAGAVHAPTDRLDALLAHLTSAGAPAAQMPWYQRLDIPLPLDAQTRSTAVLSEKLTQSFSAANATCVGLLAEIITEDRYNARVERTHNKGAVLLEHVLKLIDRLSRRAAGQTLRICVDRLGGRAGYGGRLREAFPERHLEELLVSEDVSRYRLRGERDVWEIEFATESEQRHLPVALASMLAKYVREGLMAQFNAFWCGLQPGLTPTAGYYKDAQRFLSDIGKLLPQVGLEREQFVRSR